MSTSKASSAGSQTSGGASGLARATPRAPVNGLTITRWSLSLSLTLALAVLTGAFTLVWERTVALHETQVELIGRVSTIEAEVRDLREDVGLLREEVGELREEVGELREEMGELREEVRSEIGELREEVRQLAALIRAREAPDTSAE